MFGYIKPDFDNLLPKDNALYKAVYCGLCQTLKKDCGNFARLSLTYDSVFLSLVLHNFLGVDYEISERKCIKHPVKARNMSKPNDIDELVVSLNLLLQKYKLFDDKLNKDKKYRIARFLLKKGIKKAAKKYPELDTIISDGYRAVLQLERENCNSPEQVAISFSDILINFTQNILKNKFCEDMRLLCLHLGKFLYLIDAYDDLEKDGKSGNYNVFLRHFKGLEEAIKHKSDIEFLLNINANFVLQHAKNLKFFFNCDIIIDTANFGLKKKIADTGRKYE